jgi:hypothetical protein
MSFVARLTPFACWSSLFLLPLSVVLILALSSMPAAARETPAGTMLSSMGTSLRATVTRLNSGVRGRTKTGTNSPLNRWNHAAGAPASLEISSIKPNDARWEQQVRLAPGWYYFSAEVRAEDVGTGGTGACLSLIDQGVFVSHEVSGGRQQTTRAVR